MAARKTSDQYGIEDIKKHLSTTLEKQQRMCESLEDDESEDGLKKYDRWVRRFNQTAILYKDMMVKYAVIHDAEQTVTRKRRTTKTEKLTPMQEIWKKEGKL